MSGVVIVNEYEPHHEVAGRLLELAAEQGYEVSTVKALRGEHDAALAFDVPGPVQEAFDAERDGRWPAPEELVDDDGDPNTPPVRRSRPGKAKE